MQALDFLNLVYNDGVSFIVINLSVFLVIHFAIYRSLPFFYINPIYLIFCIGFSTKYAIVLYLFINGYLSLSTFASVGMMLLSFILGFKFIALRVFYFIPGLIAYPVRLAPSSRLLLVIVLLLLLSAFTLVINSSGFGLFAEVNRFETARGSGLYTRVLDFLVPVSLVLIIAQIVRGYVHRKSSFKRYAWVLFLFIIILSHYFVNGAKITVLYNTMICLFSYSFLTNKRVGLIGLIFSASVGVFFIFWAMMINYRNNGIDPLAPSQYFSGMPLIADLFINRLISNGNTAYLLLANDVYEHIDKDSIFIRFLTPLIGITKLSSILGYDVSSLSVGKQALLYYNPDYDFAGGPTSHFDIFLMVYAPFLGYVISFAFGLFLGGLNEYIKKGLNFSLENKIRRLLIVVLLFRVSVLIVEPAIGVAYYLDAVLLLVIINAVVLLLNCCLKRGVV